MQINSYCFIHVKRIESFANGLLQGDIAPNVGRGGQIPLRVGEKDPGCCDRLAPQRRKSGETFVVLWLGNKKSCGLFYCSQRSIHPIL